MKSINGAPDAVPEDPRDIGPLPQAKVRDVVVGDVHVPGLEGPRHTTRHSDATAADGVNARAVDTRVRPIHDDAVLSMAIDKNAK